MKILYLCSQNRRRSLTAESVLNGIDGHEVRSAGTENNARIKVTEGMLGWADIIVTMEKKHTMRIRSKYRDILEVRPIVCLHLLDDFLYMDETLIDILESGFQDIIRLKD
ncbi:protein tyrosine phosphatase [Erysipelothrix sp. HDW6C]|uniref:protein tyrosine phosphatase n=1 Tax=Erysipelothrix sp. HDW6C TaxID=2714930 RepID=UPI00140C6D92|nr:protein tyrosine phosphatase [Erysipelothrix sp. HDW6C]QIK70726.1 protein tyrosine phosphatase [Erysipelothrix sp. HDW6C]